MAVDLEKLVVQLQGDIKGYQREMQKAVGVTNRQARAIENRFSVMNSNLDRIGARAARSVIAPLGAISAALGARELARMTSAWTDMQSRLGNAVGAQQAADVMDRLSDVARRTYSDLTQTTDGFLGFSSTLNALGISIGDQLDFVESLNNALVVSGAKGDQATRVMDALNKAMGEGTLQGDNLNTVLSVGGRVTDALADAMGVSVLQLRDLGRQSKIGRREMMLITTQMDRLRTEAGRMPGTIQDGFTLLNNALFQYVGRGDQAVGISAQIAQALELIADNFDAVADSSLRVLAVLAGAVLGRSLIGTAKSAITGAIALSSLTKALMGYSTAMKAAGGLGALAGPAGMVVGGAVVAGLMAYQNAASEAADRTERVNAELDRLGFASYDAADGVDALSAALDDAISDERLASLEDLRKELERIRGGGAGILPPSEDSLAMLASRAQTAQVRGFFSLSGEERDAMKQVEEIANGLRNLTISADEASTRLNAIDFRSFSDDGKEIIRLTAEQAHQFRNLREAIGQVDPAVIYDEMTNAVTNLRYEIDMLEHQEVVPQEVIDQVRALQVALDDGSMTAAQAQAALAAVADSHPDAAGYLRTLTQITDALAETARMAARVNMAYGPQQPTNLGTIPVSPSRPIQETDPSRGGKKRTPYDDAEKNLRETIAMLEAEATALNNAEVSAAGYTRILDYAKHRMDLINAAKEQGKTITPALSAEIDALAQSYVDAANAADQARVRHDAFQASLEDFRSSAEDAFTGLIEGTMSFEEALGSVLMTLAKMSASKAFATLWDGGGSDWASSLLKGFGFDQGGYTGPGGRKQPAGLVHKGEVVFSQDDVRRAGGVGAVENMRKRGGALPGYDVGGVVGQRPPAMPSLPTVGRISGQSSSIALSIDVSGARGNAEIAEMVEVGVSNGLARAAAVQERTFNARVRRANASGRKN